LREEEIIHSSLPTLRYLARLRLIEYQDWDALSSPSDDDYYRRDNDSDNGDNNYNGYHPGLDGPSRSRSFGPRMTRVPDASDAPALGRGSGPAFRTRAVACPAGGAQKEDERGWAPVFGAWQRPLRSASRELPGTRADAGRGVEGREIADVASPSRQLAACCKQCCNRRKHCYGRCARDAWVNQGG
jgi:hypothetical protein